MTEVVLVEMCKLYKWWRNVRVGGGGDGCKVAHSAPFCLFIPRCLGFSLVALFFILFFVFFSIFPWKCCQSWFLSGSKAVVHNVHIVPMTWNLLMSYSLNELDQFVVFVMQQ